jgi:hypothetical protein
VVFHAPGYTQKKKKKALPILKIHKKESTYLQDLFSHLFYTLRAISQNQTRVKLNRVLVQLALQPACLA